MFWPNANDIGNEQLSAFSCHGLNFTDYGSNSSSSGIRSGKLLAIKRIRFNEFGSAGNAGQSANKVSQPKTLAHFIDASPKKEEKKPKL